MFDFEITQRRIGGKPVLQPGVRRRFRAQRIPPPLKSDPPGQFHDWNRGTLQERCFEQNQSRASGRGKPHIGNLNEVQRLYVKRTILAPKKLEHLGHFIDKGAKVSIERFGHIKSQRDGGVLELLSKESGHHHRNSSQQPKTFPGKDLAYP